VPRSWKYLLSFRIWTFVCCYLK